MAPEITYLLLGVFSFFNVAVRAFQQINVTHGHWKRIPPTSYLFALGDILVIMGIVDISLMEDGSILLAALAMGTGGWAGCFFSMWLSIRLEALEK
jgi:hypothetical protein